MNNFAIEINNLCKHFKVFKGRVALLKAGLGLARQDRDYSIFKSLDNINLKIKPGSVHGIVGMNGAGKSTLLKVLSKVLVPTSGNFNIRGRVVALLELGIGFHDELTGRENILTNGVLMGFTKKEIIERLDEVYEFSELGEFFDRPVKSYSTGMYVRLAFSFAVCIKPEVLIIDEALSVGDAYFQQKCLRKILEFKELGTTILFVSHDLAVVKSLCETVSLLIKGKVVFTGTPVKALDLYNLSLSERNKEKLQEAISQTKNLSQNEKFEGGNYNITIEEVTVSDIDNRQREAFISGDKAFIIVKATIKSKTEMTPTCGISIKNRLGMEIFGTNTYNIGLEMKEHKQGEILRFKFAIDLSLGAGDYELSVSLHTGITHIENNYHWIDRAKFIKILSPADYDFIGVARLETSCSLQLEASAGKKI